MSASLNDGQNITIAHGTDVINTISGSNIYINDALITIADTEADNGLVHVIDAVLIPGNATNTLENIAYIKIFPNTSSSYFNVAFTTDKAQPISMEICNMLGQTALARDLGILSAGEYSFRQAGSGFDSGAYFCCHFH